MPEAIDFSMTFTPVRTATEGGSRRPSKTPGSKEMNPKMLAHELRRLSCYGFRHYGCYRRCGADACHPRRISALWPCDVVQRGQPFRGSRKHPDAPPEAHRGRSGVRQTPPGQEFLARIEGLGIRGSAIDSSDAPPKADGRRRLYAGHLAAAESQAIAAGSTHGPATVASRLASIAAQAKGANTRRASRFNNSLTVSCSVVENGQATLVNISILGAQVVSQPPLKPTQKLKIVLPDADEMAQPDGARRLGDVRADPAGSGAPLSGRHGVHRRRQRNPRGLLPSSLLAGSTPLGSSSGTIRNPQSAIRNPQSAM